KAERSKERGEGSEAPEGDRAESEAKAGRDRTGRGMPSRRGARSVREALMRRIRTVIRTSDTRGAHAHCSHGRYGEAARAVAVDTAGAVDTSARRAPAPASRSSPCRSSGLRTGPPTARAALDVARCGEAAQ